MTTTAKITAVTVTRLEGLIEECDRPQRFTNLADANRQLTVWSHTAPEGGCYDKCSFAIELDGELAYEGRYDLTNGETPSIARHISRRRDWARESGMVDADDLATIDRVFEALLG